MSRAIHPVMVGTAGHIDHGKSSLVRALTGVDPDRLKEEKERGLTIDLGFAPLEMSEGRTIGIVDVPGHEKFVRNMVAGSTALDLAILVVAADDSVMPQTIEHLEILEVLGVELGLIALTKVDLVDDEMLELAETEIRETIARTSLRDAEIVRLSTVTGEGVDTLRALLEQLAAAVEPRSADGAFRMAVQRVFQLQGIGTVITGIPTTGSVSIGDELEILPLQQRVRVRAIQAYGGSVERAVAGHSTALSVPDAKGKGLRRGVVAAKPGVFRTGNSIDVELTLLARAPALEHRAPVRFHSGTSEHIGLLVLLDRERVAPGETVVARILLAEDVSCAHADRFLLRLVNPVRTVGGGRVLRVEESSGKYRRSDLAEQIERLVAAGSDPSARLLESVVESEYQGRTPSELSAQLAMPVEEVERRLAEHEGIHFDPRAKRAFLPEIVSAGIAELRDSVDKMLRNKPLAASIKRAALRTTRTFSEGLRDVVLNRLQSEGEVRPGSQGEILFVSRLGALDPADQRDLDALVESCDGAGFRPPTPAELAASLGLAAERVDGLLARAFDEARAIQVGDHVYGARTIDTAMRAIRANCLRHDEVLDIPELRDELGTSRKFLIPLLEYVDGTGLTRLRGGERRLIPSSDVCVRLGRG
ncbi:MAG: selenocysteine-specific translation elongation factor [Planctomycetes bacterium]|nr:selenocysteine-specific translation elongation factor [Planctomycetota bacterium]